MSTPERRQPQVRRARIVAVVGVVTVTLYAACAAVHALVLNPLAAVPGRTLSEIVVHIESSHDALGTWTTLAVLVGGVLIALTLLAITWLSAAPRPSHVAAWFLGMLAAGSPASFIASVGPAAAVADAYGVSGDDASPSGLALHLASTVAFLALVGVLVHDARRTGPVGLGRGTASAAG
ncbi:hypothetical protein IGS67_07890 [Flavimobilis sp. GY10621]|uniref:Uncharacterized protein n=1 Tax=Flavimobilis rhizosphaerae TaxID=2775421 RepID=A0ABR9DQL1_9MICO|nr:hypothetical protein [Flavimobilis rhizosphaerae]MBD9699409.1 hypothetical protein [Flavimobilis rhizosphaerae]